MKFIIKTKRDGQGWKNTGEIYAPTWHDAKKKFTDNVRNDFAKNSDVLYFDDELISETSYNIDYKGPGYYQVEGGWMQPNVILDTDVLDTYSEDVYTYTIKRV